MLCAVTSPREARTRVRGVIVQREGGAEKHIPAEHPGLVWAVLTAPGV